MGFRWLVVWCVSCAIFFVFGWLAGRTRRRWLGTFAWRRPRRRRTSASTSRCGPKVTGFWFVQRLRLAERTITLEVAVTYETLQVSHVLGCLRRNFGWVRFLVVCFPYTTKPNPRKIICCGKKVAKLPLLTLFFLGWVGLGLGSSSVS